MYVILACFRPWTKELTSILAPHSYPEYKLITLGNIMKTISFVQSTKTMLFILKKNGRLSVVKQSNWENTCQENILYTNLCLIMLLLTSAHEASSNKAEIALNSYAICNYLLIYFSVAKNRFLGILPLASKSAQLYLSFIGDS